MYYLKLFDNHSSYEGFETGGTMDLPNVSHCIVENEVHYNPVIKQNPIDKLLDLLGLDSIDDLELWSYGSWLYAGEGLNLGDEIRIIDNNLYYNIDNVNSRMGEVQFVSTDWEIGYETPQQTPSSNLIFTPEEWYELSDFFQTNGMMVYIAPD